MARPLLWFALLCASLPSFTPLVSGLRLRLTHVDARENCTVEERLRRATERTHRRLASMGGVIVPVRWSQTQYIAEYLIGNPPQRAEAIVDTGSDLVWTQCASCRPSNCFRQSLPLYDPTRSRTVHAVPCNATACAAANLDVTQCTRDGKTCAVLAGYGAGDVLGVLAVEEFAFRSEKATLAFGCIVATRIVPGSLAGASGIIGLGRGKLSLVNQLGDTKFSYCLTPYLRDTVDPSHLFVGPSAGLVNGSGVTSVPFVKNPDEFPFSTFYYLPLVGITVGNANLSLPAATFDLRQIAAGVWAGGVLIDSGAPFTRLVDAAYRALRAELARQLGASLVPPPNDTSLDLCVPRAEAGRLVPPLVLHFGGGGGDVVVPPENYWGPVDRGTACMLVFNAAAMTNATLPFNETSTIGNYMQQDMHLLYDLRNGVLSFQKADCSSM